MLGSYIGKTVCHVALGVYMYLDNKKRDKNNGPADVKMAAERGMQNVTVRPFLSLSSQEGQRAEVFLAIGPFQHYRRRTTPTSDTFCKFPVPCHPAFVRVRNHYALPPCQKICTRLLLLL